MYNLTNLTGAQSLADIIGFTNEVTSNLFVTFFLIALFFIILLQLRKYDFSKAITVASFICFVLSVILVYGKLIYPLTVFLFLAIMAFSLFYLFVTQD